VRPYGTLEYLRVAGAPPLGLGGGEPFDTLLDQWHEAWPA
jgi:hypothetical protein